jgi:hypothetical protein
MAVGGVGGAGDPIIIGGTSNVETPQTGGPLYAASGGNGVAAQGDRFFLLKNSDGSISFTSKTNAQIYDSQTNPSGWQIPSTALEVNSTTAQQLQNGTITPAAYVASKLAQDLQLSNSSGAITTSSLLSVPSLLNSGVYSGEINSALILSFLRHQKSESESSKALSASALQISNSQLQQAVLSSITAALQYSQKFSAGNSTAVTEAKSDVGLLNNSLSSDQQNTFNSLVTSAFNLLQTQLNAYGKSVFSNQDSPSLKNFGEDKLKTLNTILSNAIFSVLEEKINQEILNKYNFEEIGDKTLESNSKGVVVKTPEQQTLEILQAALKNEEHQKQLADVIVGSAKDLNLEDLNPEDLKTLANTLSKGAFTEYGNSEDLLKNQIAATSSLKKDVAALLDLETKLRAGINSADHPV